MKPLWTLAALRKLSPMRPYLLLAVRLGTRLDGSKMIFGAYADRFQDGMGERCYQGMINTIQCIDAWWLFAPL